MTGADSAFATNADPAADRLESAGAVRRRVMPHPVRAETCRHGRKAHPRPPDALRLDRRHRRAVLCDPTNEEKEGAMRNRKSTADEPGRSASLADVRRIAGDIENGKALQILALRPTTEELEQAAMWSAGNGDLLARTGHSLSGTAAAILDILTADEDELPAER